MTKRLNIGTSESGAAFTLPPEIVTQSVAILAKRRVGKSYTSDVIAEELLRLPQQTVIVDPTGVHWGLRSSADGKKGGYPIVVIGGRHADIPLEEGGGEMLARSIVEQKFSAIIDTSLLRKGQTLRFLDGFLGTLYHLNTEPMHLILDEVDYYCPQKPQSPQDAITTSHVDDLVRRGGVKGIGVTLITQRSSVVNKNVLTQCEVLITLRLVHPLDIKAVMDWIAVHGDPAAARRMTESLPALPVGTAWVWWPSEEIFSRIKVRLRTTFDSGRTPKPGDKVKAPKVLAPVDLERLGEAMKATIEAAKAKDPKELQRQILALKKELAAKSVPVTQIQVAPEVVKIPAFTDAQVKRLETLFGKMTKEAERHGGAMSLLWANFNEVGSAFQKALESVATAKGLYTTPVRPKATVTPIRPKQAVTAQVPSEGLTRPQQTILNAVAQLVSYGVPQPTKETVAAHCRASPNSGGYNNNLSKLRTMGLIDYPIPGTVVLTTEGEKLAAEPEPMTQEDMHDSWRGILSKPQVRILDALLSVYPGSLSKADLAEKVEASANSGGYNNNLSKMRTMGCIDYPSPGQCRAADILFAGAA